MCNDYRFGQSPDAIREEFSQLQLPMRWAEDTTPNYPPRDDIRIGDTAPIARLAADTVELSLAPWAWKTPAGKPVFNFRSEGRRFGNSERCLIPADGFYEFTASADPKQRLKEKHLFTLAGEPWFWIAGLVKEGAFAMLTTTPGPDVAPYHDRQIVVLPRWQGIEWLQLTRPEAELLRPLPAGSLHQEQVR
ncbi:MAG: SOS response-associated peptidase family protein [Hyphomonadaceae bacterium]|nr:SOS response-associated peptidase family protein [Hyphomonadaceae bacterium]